MDSTAPASAIVQVNDAFEILSLEKVFAEKRPLEVDLGCGKGRFLIARATAHPEVNFLGIDRMVKRVRKVDSKLAKAGLTNVRLLLVEGAHAVQQMLPDDSVSAVYIFFPDPWPKRRHYKRRLFTKPFVDSLHSVLVGGGCVHIATDYLEYFDVIHGIFLADARFDPVPFPDFPDEQRTDFELEFTGLKRPIGRCSFARK